VNTIKAAEVHNIIGEPFIWLASDGGVALAPSGDAVAGIKRRRLKGMFGTIVAGPTNEHYRTVMKPRYDQMVAAGLQSAPVQRLGATAPEPHVFAPYSYDAFMVAMTTLNTLYERELYDFNITELREALQASRSTRAPPASTSSTCSRTASRCTTSATPRATASGP
jgi:hypothetical protein